jgi:hypothetical protein
MQTRNPRSTGKPSTGVEYEELLGCRMAMLGLDPRTIESGDRAMFDEIRRRCSMCEFHESCAVELRRDPNSPVWETYCPNSGTFIELAQDWWRPQ